MPRIGSRSGNGGLNFVEHDDRSGDVVKFSARRWTSGKKRLQELHGRGDNHRPSQFSVACLARVQSWDSFSVRSESSSPDTRTAE